MRKQKKKARRAKIAILGAGESGVGAAVLAKKNLDNVFVSDIGEIKSKYKNILNKYKIEWEENKHNEEKILSVDLIIKSPGIPDTSKMIRLAIEKKIKIISEIEFAYKYTNAKTICITGSNGKTTTALLIYHILKNVGLKVGLAGNIGHSFAMQVANNNFDYYVIELSSFQLDNMYDFRADIALLLNISPDHLDRYDNDFNKYIESKFRIIQNQTKNDFFIYNPDDKNIKNWIKNKKINSTKLQVSLENKLVKGAFLEDNKVVINIENKKFNMFTDSLTIKGKHNTSNSMFAALSAKLVNIRNESIRESLSDFKGVEHRLEEFISVRGIDFINDSKATNINSTWYALESMEDNVVLILGGVDKGNDYSILYDLVKSKVKVIVCLSKDCLKIKKAFGKIVPIYKVSSMDEAVKTSYNFAKDGDTVLLSPACASFDFFENYEDRGNQFKSAVLNL